MIIKSTGDVSTKEMRQNMGFFEKIKKEVNDTLDWKKVKIVAGKDVQHGEWDFNGGMMTPDPATGSAECISLMGEIVSVQIQTQENVKDMAKTLGLSVVGGVLFGPFGAIAGYFAGGNRKEVCAMIELKDGKKFLAVMDNRIYQQIMSLSMM